MGRAETKSLKEITELLTINSTRIQVLSKQRMCPGMKSSQLQSLNLQLKEAKRKFYQLRKELEARIKGEIVLVTYEIDGGVLYGRFVNLSDSEVEFLYHNLSVWLGKEIKILRIERQGTFIFNK